MKNIEIKTLGETPLEKITASWNKAFSDYAVKLVVTKDQLESRFRQNGVRLDASPGAFDGDDLVGIWMNGVRTVEGVITAYDSGTAIWPEYRSLGISKDLAKKSNEILKGMGVLTYILEVLSDNERAFNIYKKDGFEVTRKFTCYKTDAPRFDKDIAADGVLFKEEAFNESMAKILPRPEYEPSWQNSMASILAVNDVMRVISALKRDKVVGYGIVRPDTGRVAQLGFDEEFWDTNLPSLVLEKLHDKVSPHNEIAMINVEENASKTIGLLRKHGFRPWAAQYEMKKHLT